MKKTTYEYFTTNTYTCILYNIKLIDTFYQKMRDKT